MTVLPENTITIMDFHRMTIRAVYAHMHQKLPAQRISRRKKQTPVPTVKPKTYLVFTETPSPEPVKQTETAEPEHKTDWILDPIDYFGSNIIPVVVLLSFIIAILIKKP